MSDDNGSGKTATEVVASRNRDEFLQLRQKAIEAAQGDTGYEVRYGHRRWQFPLLIRWRGFRGIRWREKE